LTREILPFLSPYGTICYGFSMVWKPGSGKLRFTLSLFSTYLILIVFFCLFYFHAQSKLHPAVTSNMILGMGILLSVSTGLFGWAMDSRRNFLESEIKRKSEDVHIKNSETKKAEIASAAIYQCSRMLFSQTRFESLLENVMELIGKVTYSDEGSLMLLDSNHELYIASSRGIPEMIAGGAHIKIGQKVAGMAARERRDFLIVDGLDKYPEFEGIEPNPRIRSSIVCPLICHQELLGVLSISRTVTRENFSVADMIHVSIFASQVAQAIRNAYLYQALEQKASELEEANVRLRHLQAQLLNWDHRKSA
jgi:transcriptional regulator with GAF, ATPase, and Fis domain